LPAASFRFHLAMDTLAVRLTVPLAGSVEDFHLRVSAPCRAHQGKKESSTVKDATLFFCFYSGNPLFAKAFVIPAQL
jgi:hypothetical protein